MKRYKLTFNECQIKKQKKYRKKNKLKVMARKKVFVLVRNGSLKKKTCFICGNPKSEAHHEDYSKPLDVTWLCKQHHVEADIALRNRKKPLEKEESWVCDCIDGLGYIYTSDVKKCELCGCMNPLEVINSLLT